MTKLIFALLLMTSATTPERANEVRQIGAAIETIAPEYGFDPWDFAAVVVRESRARCDVVGKLGERGPGQVLARYVGMSNAEVATPEGGVRAMAIALDRWRRARPEENAWACYASGNICRAGFSLREMKRIKRQLKSVTLTVPMLVDTSGLHL